ncbi:MAG: hypothetical protein PHI23_05055 [Candidatus Peribacteraceae bacterium]|nr:hypothetical protein [Candidatus Peribacteraceae bacterium]
MRYKVLLGIWLLTDLALFVGTYVLAYFVRVGWIFSSDFPFGSFLKVAMIVAPVWLTVLVLTRTFSLTRTQHSFRNGAYILYASLIGVAFFSLTYYFLFEMFFSRLLLVEAFFFNAAGTWIWHIVYDEVKRLLLRRSPPAFPTLIVGCTREARALIHDMNAHRNPLKPVAVLDGHRADEPLIEGVPVQGKLNKLEEVLEREHITHLIQASELEQSINLISACRLHGATYILLPSVLGVVEEEGTKRVTHLEGRPVTAVSGAGDLWTLFFQ